MQITTIGLDLAQNVFQVHGVTDEGEDAFNPSLRRAQVLKFLMSVPRVLWASKPVARATTGRERLQSWDTRCA